MSLKAWQHDPATHRLAAVDVAHTDHRRHQHGRVRRQRGFDFDRETLKPPLMIRFTLPPGRARLATSPSPTGWPIVEATTGMLVVARWLPSDIAALAQSLPEGVEHHLRLARLNGPCHETRSARPWQPAAPRLGGTTARDRRRRRLAQRRHRRQPPLRRPRRRVPPAPRPCISTRTRRWTPSSSSRVS